MIKGLPFSALMLYSGYYNCASTAIQLRFNFSKCSVVCPAFGRRLTFVGHHKILSLINFKVYFWGLA